MLPPSVIYMHDAMQGIVNERAERARDRSQVHRLMLESKAREQFRRSVSVGLSQGLRASDLASELRATIYTLSEN
jgi:hypothetical protein